MFILKTLCFLIESNSSQISFSYRFKLYFLLARLIVTLIMKTLKIFLGHNFLKELTFCCWIAIPIPNQWVEFASFSMWENWGWYDIHLFKLSLIPERLNSLDNSENTSGFSKINTMAYRTEAGIILLALLEWWFSEEVPHFHYEV